MADSEGSVDRLQDLRGRWEENPTSRVFVQLAQEYRRRGEVAEALEVLEIGLAHHPAYQSAKVALARCQLDLDRPEDALESLRSVLEKDPTHLLAGKLVVEAHLACDDREAARDALDRYRLLGAPDEEVEELLLRLDVETERPARTPPPIDESAGGSGAADAPAEAISAPPGEIFSLPPRRVAPSLPWAGGDGGDRRELRGATERSPWPAGGPALEARYLRGLSGDVLGPPEPYRRDEAVPVEEPTAPMEAMATEAPQETAEMLESPPVAEEDVSLVREAEAASDEAASPAEPVEPEPVPQATGLPTPGAGSAATVTLGDLYLRQGHVDEAAAIYRDVLDREPGHEAARRGLETIGLRARSWITAKELLEDAHERSEGLTATKRALLERYLARLKRGEERNVSRPTS